MKNEKGITLIELLVVLAIGGTITVLIMSVLSTGSQASQRITTKQHLQTEANYIVEVIRSEYLKVDNPLIQLKIEGPDDKGNLKMGNRSISQGYTYRIIEPASGIINPENNANFKMELSVSGSKAYVIETKFSKLR